MSEEEYQGASRGIWADGPLVANTHEAGCKWLWTAKKAARLWRDKMIAAGEGEPVIARVRLAQAGYPRFAHPPEGTAILAPISDLGQAERIP